MQELSLRLAYVNFDGNAALAGVQALNALGDEPGDTFRRAYCPLIMDGIEKLATWLEGLPVKVLFDY